MMKSARQTYQPDIAIPPGETVLEAMEARGMNQAELAKRLKKTPQEMTAIIKGKQEVSPEVALRLETAGEFLLHPNFPAHLNRHVGKQRPACPSGYSCSGLYTRGKGEHKQDGRWRHHGCGADIRWGDTHTLCGNNFLFCSFRGIAPAGHLYHVRSLYSVTGIKLSLGFLAKARSSLNQCGTALLA